MYGRMYGASLNPSCPYLSADNTMYGKETMAIHRTPPYTTIHRDNAAVIQLCVYRIRLPLPDYTEGHCCCHTTVCIPYITVLTRLYRGTLLLWYNCVYTVYDCPYTIHSGIATAIQLCVYRIWLPLHYYTDGHCSCHTTACIPYVAALTCLERYKQMSYNIYVI